MNKPKFKIGDILKYISGNMFNDKTEETTFIVTSIHHFKDSYRYCGIDTGIKSEQWVEEECLYK